VDDDSQQYPSDQEIKYEKKTIYSREKMRHGKNNASKPHETYKEDQYHHFRDRDRQKYDRDVKQSYGKRDTFSPQEYGPMGAYKPYKRNGGIV
jgi:hypothetical protein